MHINITLHLHHHITPQQSILLATVTHSDTEDAAVSTHWSVIRDPAEKVSTAVNQGQLPGAASQTAKQISQHIKTTQIDKTDQHSAGRS